MSVVEVTKANFEEEVLKAQVPVVIDFWASWCGPCQAQTPILEEVAAELDGKVKVCKVNVDEQPAIAMDYRIASIPTLVFMHYGIFQKRLVGLSDKKTIEDTLISIVDGE